jgi:hypothetical protein
MLVALMVPCYIDTFYPHFAIYNRLNVWGKHRNVPEAETETFHAWYRTHRPKTES